MIERWSLNSLKFFYYIARYESVTVASEKLFVTQSAVSKQLKNLEETLGCDLFIREGKKLHLTAEGRTLLVCCEQVFPQIDQCLQQLQKQDQFKKTLILSCEPTIAMKWLIPRLVQFKQRYPEIDISLLTGGGNPNFKTQNIDLAFRRNDFDWGKAIYSEKIANEYMVCVSSQNQTQSIQQLFISGSREKMWSQLHDHLKVQLQEYKKVSLEHFYLCIEACLAGLGSTIASVYMVEKEFDFQLLKMLYPAIEDGSAYYLLSALPFDDDPRKIIFKQWLTEEMQMTQSKFSMQKAGKDS